MDARQNHNMTIENKGKVQIFGKDNDK